MLLTRDHLPETIPDIAALDDLLCRPSQALIDDLRKVDGDIMQQRTAIARAFIHDPKLILMDEPFGALDALTREQMNLEMLRIWRESGKTILFVTHSIQEAVFLASHCAVLTAGPARMAEYFPIELPFPRGLPIKTTDEFGAYSRRIYGSLGLGAGD